ncbi:MAG: hypothetical protein WAN46_00180 [Gammaproteobacteria bacterium]|jgi:hypothetical protein
MNVDVIYAPPKAATAPIFMLGAMKDAWSGNLDRIQIILRGPYDA